MQHAFNIMSPSLTSFVCALAVFGFASSVPTPRQGDAAAPETGAGLAAAVWSVLEDCLDGDGRDSAAVCFKSKALTALDRALAKPTLAIADGVALSARAGKSLQWTDPQSEKADRDALDAAEDSDQKSALLDDMLVSRMDRLASTRTIVLEGLTGQEGRGKKKDKAMQQAVMMFAMMAAAVMGPMMLKVIALMAGKALILSKIAILLTAIMALKKFMQPQHSSGGHYEAEPASHHYGRNLQLDAANDMAYSGQKQ